MTDPSRAADPVIDAAIARLTGQLPLQARQGALSAPLRGLHRTILRTLVRQGRFPTREEMASEEADVDAALARLSRDDLIVMDHSGRSPVGAYPVTTEPTAHRLRIGAHSLYAMCALDALAVASMFGCEVEIASRCHVTGTAVNIHQHSMEILAAAPSRNVRIGIRWQMPVGCAARSMCREMVFLRDSGSAVEWQLNVAEQSSLFSLDQAVAFAAGFFMPLVQV